MRWLWLVPVLSACAGTAQREVSCAADFSLSNQSGREIEQLFAGGGRDLLEPGTMLSGTLRAFRLERSSPTTLRVVFTDGTASGIGPVDLCRLPSLTVTAGGIQASPSR
jgi:hypothetical protein